MEFKRRCGNEALSSQQQPARTKNRTPKTGTNANNFQTEQ